MTGLDPAPVLERFPADMPSRDIAAQVGVGETSVRRWRNGSRGIGRDQADRIAVALGLHPDLLWDDWWAA
jgi:plasmid maintenance system antidote protein VapI